MYYVRLIVVSSTFYDTCKRKLTMWAVQVINRIRSGCLFILLKLMKTNTCMHSKTQIEYVKRLLYSVFVTEDEDLNYILFR